MTGLYTKADGKIVTTSSYSSGSMFKECPRRFKLIRIDGWKPRENKASLPFGRCVESAIEYYFRNDCAPGSGVQEFKRLWSHWEDAELTYTDREGDWYDMLEMGAGHLALFEMKWPSFGWTNPKFQLNGRKELFPGSEWAGIEDTGYIDILAEGKDGPVVVDIKTGAAALDETPGMMGLDPQLRRYAWMLGVPNVALLQFAKVSPAVKKGDSVTALVGPRAGTELLVLDVGEDGAVFTLPPSEFAEYKTASKSINGKGAKAAGAALLEKHKANSYCFEDPKNVTRQRMQYLSAVISPEVATQTGKEVGQDVAQIKHAADTGNFPQRSGVRWPNNQCTWCPCRGICLGNERLTADLLIKPTGDDWLDELERE